MKMKYSFPQLFQDMCVSLGGRVSEELFFANLTTGAEDDLKYCTKVAYAQVTYGTSLKTVKGGGGGYGFFRGKTFLPANLTNLMEKNFCLWHAQKKCILKALYALKKLFVVDEYLDSKKTPYPPPPPPPPPQFKLNGYSLRLQVRIVLCQPNNRSWGSDFDHCTK